MSNVIRMLRHPAMRSQQERIRELRAGLGEATYRLSALEARQRLADAEALAHQLAGLHRAATGIAHELREAMPEGPSHAA